MNVGDRVILTKDYGFLRKGEVGIIALIIRHGEQYIVSIGDENGGMLFGVPYDYLEKKEK